MTPRFSTRQLLFCFAAAVSVALSSTSAFASFGKVKGRAEVSSWSTGAPVGTPLPGQVSATYEYDPFGDALGATGHAATRNPFRFSTTYQDPVTGFSYFGYRFYDPGHGRWLNRDPIAEAGGLNLYGFVGNDPVNAVDVLGMAGMIPWEDNSNYYGEFILTDSNDLYFHLAGTAEIVPYEGAVPTQFLPFNEDVLLYQDSIRHNQHAVAALAGTLDTATLGSAYLARWLFFGDCDDVDESDPGYAVGSSLTALGGASALANGLVKAPALIRGIPAAFRTGWSSVANILRGLRNAPKTGTVWDDIVTTQPNYPGSVVPRSFELTTSGGQRVWVHGNATEHMAEFAQMMARNNLPETVRLASQQQLRSLQSAVGKASQNGLKYDELIEVGGWELKFSAPREVGQLPALIHALAK